MTAIGTCAHLTAITTIKQPQRRVCDACYPDDAFAEH